MPKCTNDSSRYYKGTEPSPKGLGFCAHACKLGQRKRGHDGNMWIVRENKKSKTKRWAKTILTKRSTQTKQNKPTKRAKLSKLSKIVPLDFKMVIGYFKHEQLYLDSEGDRRPFATKKALKAFVKGNEIWKKFNLFLLDFPIATNYKTYNIRLGKIQPRHIKNVKVLNSPVHTATVWEKITKKHNLWIHKPDYVVVVELHKVPVVRVTERDAKAFFGSRWEGMKEFDETFYKEFQHGVNHATNSTEGWINWTVAKTRRGGRDVEYKETEPFKGDLRLLQIGSIPTTHVDYRQFK